ncbi:MAG TPA: DUF2157 domain-containing protein [Planctomycetota bacterium]|nr:DUF2157 domain-containing protein [Planctomycetota bacterium]
MASFVKRLKELLSTAKAQGLVGDEASEALLRLAAEEDRKRHFVGLVAILGWLGGGVAAIGVSLLIAANWDDIPGLVKIVGFLVLLAGVHGGGVWIRWRNLPYEKTAHALHFMGAGMFIAGVGLIAQVYHLHERPPNAFLVWLIAIAPLAYLLRSGPITAMTIFALVLWAHMEGAFRGSPVEMPDMFLPHLMLEAGLGVALVGFGTALRKREPAIGKTMLGIGVFLVAGSLYLLGFARHWSWIEGVVGRWAMWAQAGKLILPGVVFASAVAGLAAGWRRLGEVSARMRDYLVLILAAFLLTAAAGAALDAGLLPAGPEVPFWQFGWVEHCSFTSLVVTVVAWLLWFLLAVWCLGYGTMTGKKALVNLGVVGVGLGVITRFFDLMSGLAGTGWMFLIGGLVLVATGWAMERWRRYLLAKMEKAK